MRNINFNNKTEKKMTKQEKKENCYLYLLHLLRVSHSGDIVKVLAIAKRWLNPIEYKELLIESNIKE